MYYLYIIICNYVFLCVVVLVNNIVRFNSSIQFEDYIRMRISYICLGHGRDGVCFLGIDGFVYKIFHRDFYDNNYNLQDIVTICDVEVDSYALPIYIFCINDNVVGYMTKYVKNDLFFNNYLNCGYIYKIGRTSISYTKDTFVDIVLKNLISIDRNDIKKAYKKLCLDTYKLSDVGIQIYNPCDKVLFDGEKFVVVDTFNYTKGNKDNLFLNMQLIDNAFKDELGYLYYYVFNTFIDKEMDVNKFVDMMWDDLLDNSNNCVKKRIIK